MAFYDQFTGKKSDPRDDWRDDAKTHRPQRDQAGAGEKSTGGTGRQTTRNPIKKGKEYGDAPRQDGDRRRNYGKGNPPRDKAPYDHARGKGERSHTGDRTNHYEPPRGHDEHNGDRNNERYNERNDRYNERNNRNERDRDGFPREEEHEQENLLIGRNPIREALKANRDMEKLLVARGELMGSAREIIAMAREQHVVVQEVDRARLDAMAPNHQGMIAVVSAYTYHSIEDIFALAAERQEEPFIIVLDGIMDPHNLGAIIRSAECAGAHGVIIPTRRAVGLTPAAVKASAGAVEHIPVVRETNLSRTLEYLKKEGCWAFGTSMEGKSYRNADYSGPVVLVIGNEGEGISKLVAEHCDDMITIPLHGEIGSLNASVAAGILMFAIAEKRGGK